MTTETIAALPAALSLDVDPEPSRRPSAAKLGRLVADNARDRLDGDDPYLAAATAHVNACHTHCALTEANLLELAWRRSQDPAFRAAVDAAVRVERLRADRAELAGQRAAAFARRLLQRIGGALGVIDRAGHPVDPGMVAAVLGNVRLTLEDSRQTPEDLRVREYPQSRAGAVTP